MVIVVPTLAPEIFIPTASPVVSPLVSVIVVVPPTPAVTVAVLVVVVDAGTSSALPEISNVVLLERYNGPLPCVIPADALPPADDSKRQLST